MNKKKNTKNLTSQNNVSTVDEKLSLQNDNIEQNNVDCQVVKDDENNINQAEQPKAEQPKAEQPKAEQPKAEQPKAEQPKAEQPKAEQYEVKQDNIDKENEQTKDAMVEVDKKVTKQQNKAQKTETVSHSKITPPVGSMVNMYCVHFGKILSNISIVSVVLSFLCLISLFLPILYYFIAFLIMVCGIIFTLGLIFLVNPNFISDLFVSGDVLLEYTKIAYSITPYFIGISLGTALLSIILLAIDKHQKHTGRIVTASFVLGLAVLFVALLILGLGASV